MRGPTALTAELALAAWVALFGAVAADALDDVAVAARPRAVTTPDLDGSRVLKWDSGTPKYFIAWYTGAGVWVGNDFDISTVRTYAGVKRVWLYSTPAWPNGQWDGWRLAIYKFAGGAPGSLLWGPAWGKGTSGTYGWNPFDVNWVLPGGVRAFVPAFEQYYNYPNCDPFALDDNATFQGHSWLYYEGEWAALHTSVDPYRNLMLRVVVDDEQNPGVASASLGRVKALYY